MSERTAASDGPMDGAAYLGEEIRFCREQAGMTQQQLADATHYQRPYVTRVEKGNLLASAEFADACDRIFKTAGHIGRLRKRVSERAHPDWFIPYVKLEREAESIRNYSNVFITGTLQTAEYAEAVFRAAHPHEGPEKIQAYVEARMQRHSAVFRDAPPRLWTIVHESALRTTVGGSSVMRTQLELLATCAASPHVTLQVLPFSASTPASNLPFVLLTQPDRSEMLYTEALHRGYVEDTPTAVEKARETYEWLRAVALPPQDSLSMVRRIREEYTDEQDA